MFFYLLHYHWYIVDLQIRRNIVSVEQKYINISLKKNQCKTV